MVEEKKKIDLPKTFELIEVPTQVGMFIKNQKTNEILDDKMVLVEILNSIQQLKDTLL